jgi:hypothetical protein
MAKICVECFCTGHDQEDRAERIETDDAVVKQERNSIPWIECQKHCRISADVPKSCRGNHEKPKKGNWTKKSCNIRSAA